MSLRTVGSEGGGNGSSPAP